jgi:hypothetical protein
MGPYLRPTARGIRGSRKEPAPPRLIVAPHGGQKRCHRSRVETRRGGSGEATRTALPSLSLPYGLSKLNERYPLRPSTLELERWNTSASVLVVCLS